MAVKLANAYVAETPLMVTASKHYKAVSKRVYGGEPVTHAKEQSNFVVGITEAAKPTTPTSNSKQTEKFKLTF